MMWGRKFVWTGLVAGAVVAVTSYMGVLIFGSPVMQGENDLFHISYSGVILGLIIVFLFRTDLPNWIWPLLFVIVVPIIYTASIFFGLFAADSLATRTIINDLGMPLPEPKENYGVIVGFFGGALGGLLLLGSVHFILVKRFKLIETLVLALALGAVSALAFGVFYGVDGATLSIALNVFLHSIWQGSAVAMVNIMK